MVKREKVVRQEAEMRGKAEEVISFLNMGHLANELAGNLSGGQKKLLELGRTMMAVSYKHLTLPTTPNE